ncbi:MAG TPA: MOSC N-terminal beta barrel domain-containing protein, partial [Kofleriaceae bacterium]|nr:MOSC N-terminal beta barrel domain-containing protein [Kofleriaceae bacterium]
ASLGTVRSLVRYPVKSMGGESMSRCAVDKDGIAGDRRFGVVEVDGGRVASGKQPRRWAGLLGMRAAYAAGAAGAGAGASASASAGWREALRVTLADGRELRGDDPALVAELAAMAGRVVRLAEVPIVPPGASAARLGAVVIERLETEFDKHPGVEGDLPIGLASPPGSLFDLAPLHLVTQATLDALGDVRRFRPNLVIEADAPAFSENAWIGRRLRIGASLTVMILKATSRCVIPTLAQGDLPPDPTMLKRINSANRVDDPVVGAAPCVGVYAVVVAPGEVTIGDSLTAV